MDGAVGAAGWGSAWLNQARNPKTWGGNAPGVALFDGNGGRIGFQSGKTLGTVYAGNDIDITIHPLDQEDVKHPQYMSVAAGGPDSICISFLALTSPHLDNWAIYGDLLRSCGAKWYHSNSVLKTRDNKPFMPSCFWIGGPKEDTSKPFDGFPEGVGLHLPSLDTGNGARRDQYVKHPETLCNSKPRLHVYSQLSEMTCLPIFDPPVNIAPDEGDYDFKALDTQGHVMCSPSANDINPFPSGFDILKLRRFDDGENPEPTYGYRKRDNKPERRCTHSDRLIESSHPGHTATDLCQDPNSSGPEFASYDEGLMCDMCTRILWPLCSERVQRGCFDVESKQIRPGVGLDSTIFCRDISPKAYKNVTVWT